MKYITVTEVDAVTGIRCDIAPMRTGPSMPAIEGLSVIFTDESTWPINCTPEGNYTRTPLYYGTCNDTANTIISGFISDLSEIDFNSSKNSEFTTRVSKRTNNILNRISWVGDEGSEKWNSLTEEQQTEWSVFKQSIIDIPSQIGYPENIVWPQEPISVGGI